MTSGVETAPHTSHARTTLRASVLTALETVRDPELDESVTSLGFLASCTVSDAGVAQVHLRLPTFFCAPNFAFLMVADAYDAVSSVPGVERAEIALDDHFASDTINDGVAAQAGFVGSFGGLAEGELGELRVTFLRKALLAGTDRVCRPLLASGHTPEQLVTFRLGDVPASADLERLRARRTQLGLPAGDDAHLVVEADTGAAVTVEALPLHLRKARTTRVSIEANGSYCRGMLSQRYGPDAPARPEPADD